jgi:hypothetical protein
MGNVIISLLNTNGLNTYILPILHTEKFEKLNDRDFEATSDKQFNCKSLYIRSSTIRTSMKFLYLILFLAVTVVSCESKNEGNSVKVNSDANPAAEGFDQQGSDPKAIAIADQVMQAMGGRKNWDEERYFRWNFFGYRTLWWDKLTGNVRIEVHNEDSMKILLNIFDDSGRVSIGGEEMVHADSVAKYVNKGKGMWINDSYWLFMPFKLKDSGVTLTYVAADTLEGNMAFDVLKLTFKDVGNTPQNKYHVWVDCNDHLVKQWAFFRQNNMEEPNFINPWNGYKKYNSIYLAGNRGQREITDIQIANHMDAAVFTKF